MFLFSLVPIVLAVLLEGITALKCYQCNPKWCYVQNCSDEIKGLEETFCQFINLPEIFSLKLSGCVSSTLLFATLPWTGRCVDEDMVKAGTHGCYCATDLCNADCGCGTQRTQKLLPDAADSVPPERAYTPLKCRAGFNNDEERTCEKNQKSCVAVLERDNYGKETVKRRCDEIYSSRYEEHWNEENCLKIEEISETSYGCRCFTDMCNDDCGCGVPNYTGPGSTLNRKPDGDDDGSQQRGEDDRQQLGEDDRQQRGEDDRDPESRYPNGAYPSTNATWLIRILIVQWCLIRLF